MPRGWEEGHKDELVPRTEMALLGGHLLAAQPGAERVLGGQLPSVTFPAPPMVRSPQPPLGLLPSNPPSALLDQGRVGGGDVSG